jgi:hypothetical protein
MRLTQGGSILLASDIDPLAYLHASVPEAPIPLITDRADEDEAVLDREPTA